MSLLFSQNTNQDTGNNTGTNTNQGRGSYYQPNLYRSSDYNSGNFGFSSSDKEKTKKTTEKKSTKTTTKQPNVSGLQQGKIPSGKGKTKGTTSLITSKKKSTSPSQPFPARVDIEPNKDVLYISPLNSIYEIGEEFTSEVKFYNPIKAVVNHITVNLNYDPAILKVDYVDDTVLRSLVNLNSDNQIDHTTGKIIYNADFSQPSVLGDTTLFEIGFTVVRKSTSSSISFVSGGDSPTTMSNNGIDVLGDEKIEDDGVISTVIETYDPKDEDLNEELFISPITIRDEKVKTENVNLNLVSKKSSYDVDDEFIVDVVLKTKEPIFIQTLELCINFNPKKLEVLDWDEENWIRRGINIYDGDYHNKFPFDFQIKNDADNSTGTIDYKMGLTSDVEINSGTIASIKFKALEKVNATSIKFSYGKDANKPSTKITYLGKDYLDQTKGNNLKDIYISIK